MFFFWYCTLYQIYQNLNISPFSFFFITSIGQNSFLNYIFITQIWKQLSVYPSIRLFLSNHLTNYHEISYSDSLNTKNTFFWTKYLLFNIILQVSQRAKSSYGMDWSSRYVWLGAQGEKHNMFRAFQEWRLLWDNKGSS